jgi:hypothetical protein
MGKPQDAHIVAQARVLELLVVVEHCVVERDEAKRSRGDALRRLLAMGMIIHT